MTPDTFAELFTREGLRPFQPRPGAEGFMPMLEVHTATEIVVFALALENFNDGPTRFGYMGALGHHCAGIGPVAAIRFGSEAWMRSFREDEWEARGNRRVDSYDDKTEHVVVFGEMADGPRYVAHAPLHRRPTGAVSHLGEWQVVSGTQHRSPLLEAFWEGYHQAQATA